MIEIVDNFLDDFYIDYISDAICNVNWNYRKNISIGNNEILPWMHGFNRPLFDLESGITFENQKADIFIPFILKVENYFNLDQYSLLRARLDMTVRSPENTLHIPHKDMNINHYVCILYCNDTDGDTIIYNETCKQENYTIQKKISPLKNRLVFFDGSYYHTGHSPSKNNYRILSNNF